MFTTHWGKCQGTQLLDPLFSFTMCTCYPLSETASCWRARSTCYISFHFQEGIVYFLHRTIRPYYNFLNQLSYSFSLSLLVILLDYFNSPRSLTTQCLHSRTIIPIIPTLINFVGHVVPIQLCWCGAYKEPQTVWTHCVPVKLYQQTSYGLGLH